MARAEGSRKAVPSVSRPPYLKPPTARGIRAAPKTRLRTPSTPGRAFFFSHSGPPQPGQPDPGGHGQGRVQGQDVPPGPGGVAEHGQDHDPGPAGQKHQGPRSGISLSPAGAGRRKKSPGPARATRAGPWSAWPGDSGPCSDQVPEQIAPGAVAGYVGHDQPPHRRGVVDYQGRVPGPGRDDEQQQAQGMEQVAEPGPEPGRIRAVARAGTREWSSP